MERLAKNPYWVGGQEGHNRFYNKIRWWVDRKDIIDFTIIASMTLEIILVSNIWDSFRENFLCFITL